MTLIYKILARAEWEAAVRAGRYDGSAVDVADGFIHFSSAAQASETARKYFLGQPDLVVLELESGDLGPGLKWEPARGGQLFAHLYGAFDTALVRKVRAAPLDERGVPVLELAD